MTDEQHKSGRFLVQSQELVPLARTFVRQALTALNYHEIKAAQKWCHELADVIEQIASEAERADQKDGHLAAQAETDVAPPGGLVDHLQGSDRKSK